VKDLFSSLDDEFESIACFIRKHISRNRFGLL